MRLNVIAGALAVLCGLAPAQLGRIDTVGGTTYDWQFGGPTYRYIVNSPGNGIHVVWIRSRSELTTFPDRNMAHNHYDYAERRWLANDPTDYMNSGEDVFLGRAGFGTVDIDPRDGRAVISAYLGSPVRPDLAREVSIGSFLYEYASGSPVLEDYLWPVTAVDPEGWVHAALIDLETTDRLWYARMRTWGEWEPARAITDRETDPQFPCHNITAARVSRRVALTWTRAGREPAPGYYRETTDGGTTWLDPQQLPFPPAYGGDTVPSFHLGGLFPYYDRSDRLHVVAAVMPYIGNQGFIQPAEIWHWCRDNSPHWSRIHRAGADSLGGSVGYNALFAGRPSIGEDRVGGLHVAWEQFDPLNVEPQTERLRADIWWARDNSDNGASWRVPERITDPDSSSKRYPVVMDFLSEDTLRVLYLVDLVAGFAVQAEGPVTRNPVVVQHLPIVCGAVSGPEPVRPTPAPGPTIIRGLLNLQSAIWYLQSETVLLDISGRKVMELQPGDNDVRHLAPGVYFIRTEGPRGQGAEGSNRKVVIQR